MSNWRLYGLHILEAIAKIHRIQERGDLSEDEVLYDAVLRNLQTLSGATRHLPDGLKAEHQEIPWREISDFQNILVQDYLGDTDPLAVATVIEDHLYPLESCVTAMLKAPAATIQRVLASSPLFEGFTRRECAYLSRFFLRKTVPEGEDLIEEGMLLDEFYLAAAGSWEIYLPKNADYLYRPAEVHLRLVDDIGMVFGEYSFIDNRPTSASVRALNNAEVCVLSRDGFEQIVASSNRAGKLIYKNLLTIVIARLRKQTEELDWQYLTKEA